MRAGFGSAGVTCVTRKRSSGWFEYLPKKHFIVRGAHPWRRRGFGSEEGCLVGRVLAKTIWAAFEMLTGGLGLVEVHIRLPDFKTFM